MTNSEIGNKKYVAFGYDDTDEAPVMSVAESLKEAKKESREEQQGWVWYEYTVIGKNESGRWQTGEGICIGVLDDK
jgi:hypothetical protein